MRYEYIIEEAITFLEGSIQYFEGMDLDAVCERLLVHFFNKSGWADNLSLEQIIAYYPEHAQFSLCGSWGDLRSKVIHRVGVQLRKDTLKLLQKRGINVA